MSSGLYRSAHAAHGGEGIVRADPVDIPPPAGPPAIEQPSSDGGSAAGNSAIMAVGSLVSRGTGFLRTLVISAALGTAVGDAYTTAQILPGMVFEFLLGGVLTSVLIPVLVRRRDTDHDRGELYTQRLLSLAVVALFVATVLAVLAAPLLTLLYIDGDTSGDTRNLINLLALLMLPMIFFSGLSALMSAILNVRGHFAAPMFTPILNNIIVIASFGLFIAVYGAREDLASGDMSATMILLVGGGTLLGIIVQVAGLVPVLRKVGFHYRWRGQWRELGLRELGQLGGWMFCYVAVSQLGLIVVIKLANAASAKGDPGPLIYNNVFLLVMTAHGIIAVSIITALLPRMSAAAAEGRYHDFADDVSRGTRTVTAVLAPIAVCYAVLSYPLSVILFHYGAFTSDNATDTGVVLATGALALVPFAISQLFTFAFYALPDTRTPALVNIPVVALRVLVQVGLFLVLSTSTVAAGLMFGNAVSYVAAAVVFAMLLRRRIGPIGAGRIMATFGKVLVAAVGAALVGYLVLALLPDDDSADRMIALARLVVGGGAICLSYLGLAMALRITEVTSVVGMVRRRLGFAR
ncbi:murein biosynthesis integral membrane protein MurJ [Asanoa iriomotensis]|uniref:Lipid II flippase MurJ n=1 Tax=Asanoa iriomotensis TaxID=234613 RepID=A0ABQ4C1F2_9ACTN|nr:murein biosynthesis integral membrane protein MurJ [Asanoa iriomotensis]GIF56261.1 lipid II flippase MurJ [Asanoa iriomotensis]